MSTIKIAAALSLVGAMSLTSIAPTNSAPVTPLSIAAKPGDQIEQVRWGGWRGGWGHGWRGGGWGGGGWGWGVGALAAGALIGGALAAATAPYRRSLCLRLRISVLRIFRLRLRISVLRIFRLLSGLLILSTLQSLSTLGSLCLLSPLRAPVLSSALVPPLVTRNNKPPRPQLPPAGAVRVASPILLVRR
jgi:hypothetical protein